MRLGMCFEKFTFGYLLLNGFVPLNPHRSGGKGNNPCGVPENIFEPQLKMG
jgi:hypothetical protein